MLSENEKKILRILRGFRTSLSLAACFVTALVVGSSTLPLQAQSGVGTIQGTVHDTTGAVIPSATVHVVNKNTGVSNDTRSNGVGFYSIPSLFQGDYQITFASKGMKKYETTINLQVAQTAVIDPVLVAGGANEQIVVAGNEIQLTTLDSGTISSTLENARINQLPMNGRQLLTLTNLTTPGVEGGGQLVNGNMYEGLEYVQDGAPLTNRNFGGAQNSAQAQLPDPDAVGEVRLETSASSAQFATPATGIITTKSGTNQLHGTFFETARNNYFGVAKARQDPSNLVAPHLVRNEAGGSIGGPIVIPKLYNGHDRSFFFFAYERYSLRSFTNELVSVPSLAMRQGDFSQAYNGSGVLQAVYDPNTSRPANGSNPYARTAFPNNQIPLGRISPLAKVLYAISPLPTSNDNPIVQSNYTAPNLNNVTIPNITFRLDHTFTENNSVYLRYTQILQDQRTLRNFPSNSPATVAGAGLPAGASGFQDLPVATFSGALGFTHIFSPTFFSETVLSNEWFNQYFVGGGNPNFNYEQFMGLPNNFGEVGFPEITGATMPYGGTQFNYREAQVITNIDENLTKILGKHKLQFGGRYRHERFGYLPDRISDQVSFGAAATADINEASGTNYTGLPNTGIGEADLFLGAAEKYTVSLNGPYMHFRDMEFDSYIQDNYRILNNMTLNFGLRWEVHPAAYVSDGLMEGFDIKNKAIVLPKPTDFYVTKGYTTQAIITNLLNLGTKFETPQTAGVPNTIFYNYDYTFSPRIGIAYTPWGSHGTVLRAGYGRYISPVPVRNSIKNNAQNPPFTTQYSQSYMTANQSPDGLPNYLIRAPQTVVAGKNSANVVSSNTTTSITPGIALTTVDSHDAPQYATEVNVTVEQPLKGSSALRISYLYNHGQNLLQGYKYNNPIGNYVWESTTGTVPPTGFYSTTALGPYDQTLYGNSILLNSTGYSNDNALQINYQRLYKKGFAYQIFYVYSRAFRVGGNSTRDGVVYPSENFAPGILPGTDYKTLNRFENYQLDTAIPEHHIRFNGIVDLPIGKGHAFFGNVNRFVNELIGGYQVAGDGNISSQYFQPATSNWGPTNPLHVYKHAHPVTDCRSGTCYKAYQWFNGYLSPLVINSPKGVSGLPSNYVPYQTPIDNTPGTSNFGSNNVSVPLSNGNSVQVGYLPGPAGVNPFSHTYLRGPFNWTADISLFKVFPINDRFNLRINVDAFNAFNVQGYVNPNTTDGIESLRTSNNSARQIQLTARLTF